MLRVKLAVEGGDAAACDGVTAAKTQSALPGVIVPRTEGPTIQLHETAAGEGLQTVLMGARERDGESDGGEWGRVQGRTIAVGY